MQFTAALFVFVRSGPSMLGHHIGEHRSSMQRPQHNTSIVTDNHLERNFFSIFFFVLRTQQNFITQNVGKIHHLERQKFITQKVGKIHHLERQNGRQCGRGSVVVWTKPLELYMYCMYALVNNCQHMYAHVYIYIHTQLLEVRHQYMSIWSLSGFAECGNMISQAFPLSSVTQTRSKC